MNCPRGLRTVVVYLNSIVARRPVPLPSRAILACLLSISEPAASPARSATTWFPEIFRLAALQGEARRNRHLTDFNERLRDRRPDMYGEMLVFTAIPGY